MVCCWRCVEMMVIKLMLIEAWTSVTIAMIMIKMMKMMKMMMMVMMMKSLPARRVFTTARRDEVEQALHPATPAASWPQGPPQKTSTTTAAKSTSKCPRSGAHRRALAFCCTGVAINKCGPGALSATPRSEHPNKTTLRNENTTTKRRRPEDKHGVSAFFPPGDFSRQHGPKALHPTAVRSYRSTNKSTLHARKVLLLSGR